MPRTNSFKKQQEKVQAAARAGYIYRERKDQLSAEVVRHLGTPAGAATAFACGLLLGLVRRGPPAVPNYLKTIASVPLRYITAGFLR